MDQKETGMCRRDFPRIPKQATMTVRRLEYPMTNVETKTAITKDLAQLGVCFTSSELYEPGAVLNLDIDLRGWQHYLQNTASILDAATMSKPLTAIAEVVWSKKLSADQGYEIAVRFKDIYEDDLQAFHKYLAGVFGRND